MQVVHVCCAEPPTEVGRERKQVNVLHRDPQRIVHVVMTPLANGSGPAVPASAATCGKPCP